MFGKLKLMGLAAGAVVILGLGLGLKYYHGAYVKAVTALEVEKGAHEVTKASFGSYRVNAETQVRVAQKALDELGLKYNTARLKSEKLSKRLAKVDFREQVNRFPAWLGRNINRATAIKLREFEDKSADFSRGGPATATETP